jgi:hypothetical protein
VAPSGYQSKHVHSPDLLKYVSAAGCDLVAQHGTDLCNPGLAPFGDELENSTKFQPLLGHVSMFQLSVRKYRAVGWLSLNLPRIYHLGG